ncbi:MAG: phenylalanine--tRNA ligase beta subunit-related protein [Candidatus Shapirobacteria bacterium]|jgi:phenylalanyl-tRNA synthetase beta chain|nr:phenylalanine--tRNA ligase beta subunit-related protein [Candidatus Shapirobacteria bacterium]
MKIILSELKKFLPELKVESTKLRDDLTMIGHFTNFFEEIENETVFDLDIKVNRGDCLGYYGLARDLSVFYNIDLKLPFSREVRPQDGVGFLPIEIKTDKVTRVMAIKLSGLKNSKSPKWLQDFLKYHGSKSINTIVDLTNYIMFLYGIPNHAFDTAKSTDNLIWEINSKFKEFTSLDGSKLTLNNEILMINNPNKALSLSFWGGESCSIDLTTTETIIELAIYDRTTVRQNSRQLKSVTEASVRLEKDLDPELIPQAFNHLINLILENCDGQITSQLFDHYPNKITPPQIEFDPQKPSLVSGIEIPVNFSIDCLTRLGCQSDIQHLTSDILITPPSIRKDISIEADLIEEVIRFWGYYKIPTNEPLDFKNLPDITPPEIYLIESLKDQLIDLGYDEILSWPLVTTPTNQKTVITTENSINSEAIYLRQSLIPSLTQQLDQYTRFKLPEPQFFEIGKVFSKEGNKYIEKNSLALYNVDQNKLISDLQQLKLEGKIINDNFFEIIIDNLPKPKKYIPQLIKNNAVELNSQIITLDANLTLDTKEDSIKLIEKYSKIIGSEFLWKLIITDIYQDSKNSQYKYTFQASYFNLDDKKAKNLHLKSFNLL